MPLSALAAARRLDYRRVTEAQVTSALLLLSATDGFADGHTLLAMNKRRSDGSTEMWLVDGEARVTAAARHVAATPGCGAAWRDASVLFLRQDIAVDVLVRSCLLLRCVAARVGLLRRRRLLGLSVRSMLPPAAAAARLPRGCSRRPQPPPRPPPVVLA